MNVFEAEPPGGGGIEIVEDVLILGAFDWFEVDKSGDPDALGRWSAPRKLAQPG